MEAATPTPVVVTKAGQVRGRLEGGVRTYLGVPYAAQELTKMDDVTGGSPYGAGVLAGADGSRRPSANELAIARFQGKHLAQIAAKLAA